jgi:hypothetical protein
MLQKWCLVPKGHDQLSIPEGNINIGACYTKGMLWTNTDPRWTWKHVDFQCIRCRIKLPWGTQVIIDRSPTGYPVKNCTLPGGGPSKYADVLLPPGKFHIDKVVCYRKHDELADVSTSVADVNVVYINLSQHTTRLHHDLEDAFSDEDYAAVMLAGVDQFIDVRLSAISLLKIPHTL